MTYICTDIHPDHCSQINTNPDGCPYTCTHGLTHILWRGQYIASFTLLDIFMSLSAHGRIVLSYSTSCFFVQKITITWTCGYHHGPLYPRQHQSDGSGNTETSASDLPTKTIKDWHLRYPIDIPKNKICIGVVVES